ncbi:MAG: twin-arginine translocase TatA/TatE family subunit, partial [Nitrospinae bacterium]|nr:twin-arginine translocase TatA/TatE family subunit [Nitrospinota bacterium]
GKLPEIGAGLGRGIRNFKKATKEVQDEVETTAKLDEDAGVKTEAKK